MADDSTGSPGAARGKRPAPTIDLKATEIASEPVASPSQASDSKQEFSSASAGSGAASTAAAEPPAGARPPEPPNPASPDPRIARSNAMVTKAPWGALAAGVAGSALTLAVVLGLWGMFGRSGDPVLAARLATIEAQARDLANRPQPAGLDQRVFADLAARVGAAEQAVGRIAALEAGLAKLEAAPARAPADPALASRISALEASARSLADLGQKVDAAMAAAQKATGAVPADVAALATRIAALEQGLKALEQRAATRTSDRTGRLAFVAVALRSAAERGDPFTQELAAAKALGADPAALAALEPFAASGMPRPVTLARELSQLVTPILAAAGPDAARDGGIIERLQANAERLVRIRRIDEAPGDEPATIVSRAEVKATHGDIAGALAEIARLPEAARAPAQAWMRKAEGQVAAFAALKRLTDSAIDALPRGEP